VIYQNKYTNSGSQAQGKSWKLLILCRYIFSGNHLTFERILFSEIALQHFWEKKNERKRSYPVE